MMSKLKKTKRFVIGFLSSITLGTFVFSNIFAFAEKTHRYITTTSLENVLELNKKNKFLKSEDRDFFSTITDYSLKPDEDETEGAFKNHFYNPATKTNFMGESYSAIEKFKEHYKDAKKYYSENDKELAFQELGRAIHFLEDLNTPVHTGYNLPTDAVFKLPLHVNFEKICDNICNRCHASINKTGLSYYSANSPETIAKSASIVASNNYDCLTDDQDEHQEMIAKNAILNAQRSVTGLFYKYFTDINDSV